MKPLNGEMHSAVDAENRAEPHEVFVDLGVLIVEGRTPGGAFAAGRGYGEGPHCATLGLSGNGNIGRHDCDPSNNYLCKRVDNYRKHMQLLWQNNIPMCIEVLLCSDCQCGAQSYDVANIPSSADILLEQWMITMVTKRCTETPQISIRGLFQAVRSQLHFSQLAAWWSSSKGTNPLHVNYRVTVPGEAFASQFSQQPIDHSFPVAAVVKNTAVKVCVRTLPRMEAVPKVTCAAHPSVVMQEKRNVQGAVGGGAIRKSTKETQGKVKQSQSLLGDSLLDPPQSLDLARRYQSPSRCCSPSMEAPEHLLFVREILKPEGKGKERAVPWRDCSPPSPPLGYNSRRRPGRQGLARRRDANNLNQHSPGLLDDRMQNPCNRPGKHHCRCAYDEDSDTVPLTGCHSSQKLSPHCQLSSIDGKRAASLKRLQQCAPIDEDVNEEEDLDCCAHTHVDLLSDSKGPIDGILPSYIAEDDSDCFKAKEIDKLCNRVRKISQPDLLQLDLHSDKGMTIESKSLNLDLSPQEFQEVLAVLRDKSGPSVIHGTRKSPEFPHSSESSFPCSSKSKSVIPSDNSRSSFDHLEHAAFIASISEPSTSKFHTVSKSPDKADLFMGAILRTCTSNRTKETCLPGSSETFGNLPSSVLAEKLIKCKHKNSDESDSSCSSSSSSIDSRFYSSAKLDVLKRNCDNNESRLVLSSLDFIKRQKESSFPSVDSNIASSKVDVRASVRDDCANAQFLPKYVQIYSNTARARNEVPVVVGKEAEGTAPKCFKSSKKSCEPQMYSVDSSCNSNSYSNSSNFRVKNILSPEYGDASSIPHKTVINEKSGNFNTTSLNDSPQSSFKSNISSDGAISNNVAKSRPKSPLSVILPSKLISNDLEDYQSENLESCAHERPVPSALDKAKFRRSLDSAASMVFHSRTGLPLTSSPAPVRRGTNRFDFDSSLNSVSAIRSALFDITTNPPVDDTLSISSDDTESDGSARSPCSPGTGLPYPSGDPVSWLYYSPASSLSLLGSFEESVLNGRLEPVSTVQGFSADIGASGSFCPSHLVLPVTVFFYTLGDNDKVSTPYLGHINLGKKGYNVPRSGTIQVTLFNPLGTVIKMFVVTYDLSDMPASSQTFLRQRTLYMPANSVTTTALPDDAQKWLRYLIHLRFASSKSGRIYLHSDMRMIIFRKSDLDTATAHGVEMSYELRSFTHGPTNPKFSPRK